jgi:hypothetical protein
MMGMKKRMKRGGSVKKRMKKKKKRVKKNDGGSLKAVPEGKKGKGLKKLPKKVRNKMGFMKRGGKVI